MIKIPINRLKRQFIKSNTDYEIDILDLQCLDPKLASRFEELKKELRFLMRSNNNLQESQVILRELLADCYKGNPYPQDNITVIPRSLFCHAASLYVACFVRGEKQQTPLRFLNDEIITSPIHIEVRDMRDKIFGHLDQNHLMRNDHIYLKLERLEDNLIPTTLVVANDYISAFHKTKIEEWYALIETILDKIKVRVTTLTDELNKNIEAIEVNKLNN